MIIINPVFVICVLIFAFLVWIGIAFLFPSIGKVIKLWLNGFKYITKEDDLEEDDYEK